MSEPFLAEVRIVGFNFAPRGWATCDGQILPINQNQALFSLLGTTYGGDGRTNFALPDLRGRTPIHVSSAHAQGEKAGAETHQLTEQEMPQHTHAWKASSASGDNPIPAGNVLAGFNNGYGGSSSPVEPAAGTLANAGAGVGHNNMQPFLTLNFVIALNGLYPSRN